MENKKRNNSSFHNVKSMAALAHNPRKATRKLTLKGNLHFIRSDNREGLRTIGPGNSVNVSWDGYLGSGMAYFREMGTDWVSTIPAMEGRQVFKNWPKDWVGRDENPAKFERCVRDVQRKGGAGNAYAVCHASMNPQQRYTAERLYGYPESEFERAEELGYRNFRGKATHLVKGDPATVLKKHGKRVLVHVDHYGTPFYGWMDASDVVTLSAFKKRFGFPPEGAVKRNPESTSAAMYESFHGSPSTEIVEVEEREHYHEHLAELGVLVELHVHTVTGLDRCLGFGDVEAGGESNPRTNVRIVSKVNAPGVKNQVFGEWFVSPTEKSKLSYIQTQLDNARQEEPGMRWTLEARGESGDWHGWNVRDNPIWPFGPGQPLGSREYVGHVGKRGRVSKSSMSSIYKGYTVYASGDAFTVPQIDRESRFDTKKDARRFIDAEIKDAKRNPKKRKPADYRVLGQHFTSIHPAIDFAYREAQKDPRKWVSIFANGQVLAEVKDGVEMPSMLKWEIEREANPKRKGPISSVVGGVYDTGAELDRQLGRAIGFRGNPPSDLYQKALDADEAYQKALVKEYGKRAGDMRYQPIKQPAHVRELGKKFEEASDKWREAMEEHRRKGNPDGYVLYWNGVYSPYIPTLASAKKQAKEKSEQYGYKVYVVDAETNKTVATYDSPRKNPGSKSNPDPISTSTVMLCSNEAGTQLYLIGGDQSLDLDELKFSDREQEKELVTVGECFFVSYLTRKDFDKHEEIVYEHELGEETGVVPTLVYDRLNKRLMLSGGEYHIEQPLMSTSPGLEN